MARVSGNDLPRNKRGAIALTYVFGIGRTTASKILNAVGVDEDKKVSEWTDDEIKSINKFIGDDLTVEGELRSEIQLNIKRLQDIGSYRGIRHRKSLPLRGQKTKNNSRTRKGKKKTVAGKKKAVR
ncbi:MAG: small subunit ribosomal protein S13 [Planctomycetota bacterium]|jgi:small subunit ribosomal protein S13